MNILWWMHSEGMSEEDCSVLYAQNLPYFRQECFADWDDYSVPACICLELMYIVV